MRQWYSSKRGGPLRFHPLIHPTPESCDTLFRPGFIARHAAIFQPRVNRFGFSLHILVGREIKSHVLHRGHVRIVTKQRTNVASKTQWHLQTSAYAQDFNLGLATISSIQPDRVSLGWSIPG